MSMFTKATKKQAKLRLALIGISGSGKTYTSLKIATQLGIRVALIDTENASASKYSDEFQFDTLVLDSYEPQRFTQAIKSAEIEGYEVIIIDSLSHAWSGKGGILEQHDKATMKQKTQNSYTAWRDVTPMHNELIDAIIQSKCHVIATMRAKTEYVQEQNNGKTQIRKVGLAPIQRDGMEYEFDVVADMDNDNNMIVTKTRCSKLNGQVYRKPNGEVSSILKSWLDDGVPVNPTQEQLTEIDKLTFERDIPKEHLAQIKQALDGKLSYEKTGAAIKYLKSLPIIAGSSLP